MNSRVIEYLYPAARPLLDYVLVDRGSGPVIEFWNTGTLGSQPSAQTIATAEASQEFADWLASHGGDATLTLRRQAKEALDNAVNAQHALDRALVLVLIDEVNALRQWMTSFKAATAAATSLSNLQTRVAALNNMPDRTATQARTAIKNKIDAGDSDA